MNDYGGDPEPFADPFAPEAPSGEEYGRVFTHGRIEAGWACRVCGADLYRTAHTPTGALVVCLRCDPIS